MARNRRSASSSMSDSGRKSAPSDTSDAETLVDSDVGEGGTAPRREPDVSESPVRPTILVTLRKTVRKVNLLIYPLIIFLIVFSLLHDRFLTSTNLLNVARAASVTTIIGVGQTFLITSRNLDLSVGSQLGLLMALSGTAIVWYDMPVVVGVGIALLAGGVLGAVNGLIVTKLKLPALLATLGTLVAYRGIVNQYMYGETATRFPDAIVFLGQGMLGPIPVPVLIAAVTVLVAMFVYRYTKFGRYAVAIGGNEMAAEVAGIKVQRWKIGFFMVQGALVGIAALVFLGQLNATHPSVGQALELHIIAGTILGGTMLFGGYGSVGGMAIGMFLIDVLENGLVLGGAGFFVQQIFLGFLLVFAVAVQMQQFRRRSDQE